MQTMRSNIICVVYEDESIIKDLSKSKEHLEKSLQCYEKLFDDLKDNDQFKVSIVDTFITAYKTLSQVHIKSGQIEEALMVCERGRARALRDLLYFKYNTTEKTEAQEPEFADVKRISSYKEACILFYNLHLNKVTYDCWIISTQTPSTFYYDEKENIKALAKIVLSLSEDDKTNLNTGYFQYLVDNSFRQMSLREGMKCDEQSMNLLDHENGEPAGATKSSNLRETTLTVFRRVDRWCASADDEDDIEPLEVLSRRLLSPVINQLTHDEVIIIPDGPLFTVPFAALQDPLTGKYLSETKLIRLAPSLTTLKILQESSDENYAKLCSFKSGALIIGNPTGDLPGAEKEAVEIGNLLGVQPLIGKQATKEVILEKLKRDVSVIHFAAHGRDKNGQILLAPSTPPMNSCPADDKGNILTVKEAQESGIRAQLVVLSCCHSGKGDIRSEGVVGIARAFLAAGARAVVASLWAIDDRATKFFMLKLYSHLKNGESASKSLQQAMKEMREIERYKEPKYWAAFFLIGDDVTITV
ncbi:Tetratricopeptide repeat protein 28 [Exaiptasia diaphana]|nr:Tetratricopeptide repeat protein 28 [Exaiptasia diaphana]